MARLVGVCNLSHSPFCYMPPERWNDVRARRSLRADVPFDDLDENRRNAERIRREFAVLREQLAAVQPDVIIVLGDDQLEAFDFSNFPAFAVYVGEQFEGHFSTEDVVQYAGRTDGSTATLKRRVGVLQGHPGLATAVLTGLMQRGFDPAFCMEMPKPEAVIGHAISSARRSPSPTCARRSSRCSSTASSRRNPARAAATSSDGRWARPSRITPRIRAWR